MLGLKNSICYTTSALEFEVTEVRLAWMGHIRKCFCIFCAMLQLIIFGESSILEQQITGAHHNGQVLTTKNTKNMIPEPTPFNMTKGIQNLT